MREVVFISICGWVNSERPIKEEPACINTLIAPTHNFMIFNNQDTGGCHLFICLFFFLRGDKCSLSPSFNFFFCFFVYIAKYQIDDGSDLRFFSFFNQNIMEYYSSPFISSLILIQQVGALFLSSPIP